MDYHGSGCNCLFLDVAVYLQSITSWVEETQKSLDDGVEVRNKGIMFNTFTKVDEDSSGMWVYSGSGIFESRYEDWEQLPLNSIFA